MVQKRDGGDCEQGGSWQVVRSGHIWDFLGDIWTRRTWLWMGLCVRACICTVTGMKRDFQVFA